MNTVTVRLAQDAELASVAALRWQWVLENQREPRVARAAFIDRFVAWARENAHTHRCVVVVRGDVVIGMAWLAIIRRVPTPCSVERESGDMQCVYIVPEERGTGWGGRLIDAVLDYAHELGLERVTVHSSVRAISVYARHGFTASPRLLKAELADPSR